ncbi:MAG: cysteine--tRNA ligase [Candidatus Nanoarchaeia archaeon]|nr:cysteine--tRNA ligase [Candidatus Nanoarchaeia archaeon]MDD5054047.1 cysteine--tRNA ligase [Candidatus Nanoarchaeia archaeon]MDD5499465.1 cysteine--tRNA ligase [Candidatus Nanoarchaeia archaeon]
MALMIYNTLNGKKEEFKPINGKKVGFYICGPTVNNHIHIGHARSYIFWDLISRYLSFQGFEPRVVSNITDIAIDDKILKELKKLNKSFFELTTHYMLSYFFDRKSLGLKEPDINCLATQHINEMIELVQKLLDKKYAYKADDGIYFDISKFKDYGKLAKIKPKELKEGASNRVKAEEYDKDSAADFVLWKNYKEGEPYWHSPFGKGRPGWHIECSAMSMKYLGESFDIHAGGEDNIFPHHENEIAQSEAATGKTFSKYWIHMKHVLMNGEKMSKSKGNFITVKDAVKKYGALLLRFFFLTTHYRKNIDFTEKELENAKAKLKKIILAFKLLESAKGSNDSKELMKKFEDLKKSFESAMNDDFNTSLAITQWIGFCKEIQSIKGLSRASAKKILIYFGRIKDVFFGDIELFDEKKGDESKKFIEIAIDIRNKARSLKNFELSDYARKKLEEEGIKINDSKDSASWEY